MWNFLNELFDVSDFNRRWDCGHWTAEHGWLHILSDLGVWSAYLAIPCVLVFFAIRRKELPYRRLFWLFGAFILACGTTHLMEAVIFWWPAYRLAGLIKVVTAVISWVTVFALVPVIPRALSLRSPRDLEREIAERKKIESELELRVLERTAALANANAALQEEVAERGRIEAELRSSEQRERDRFSELEAVLRATPTFIWIAHDRECHRITGNAAANALLRIPDGANATATPDKSQPMQRTFREYRNGVPIPGDQLPLQVAAAQGIEVQGSEFSLVFEGNQVCHVFGNAVPLRNPDGSVRGAIAAFMDVTDLKNAVDAIQEAGQRKDEFLAMLSHELRNPLAPLRNALAIIKREQDPATIKWALDTMEAQVEQLIRLVDDLLDVSRIMQGRIELKRTKVDLATVVDRAQETSRPGIDSQGHHLTIELPHEPIWLDADPVRLAQVFSNLLNNAAKYTEANGLIRLSARRQGDQALIQVTDNGIGIDPPLLSQIFDLFTQANRSVELSQGGLGIGLTLVRSLVEMHGGAVTASSAGLGHGSTFTVELPIQAAGPVVENKPWKPESVVSRRVLVVEDNIGSAEILATLLKRFWGHEVRTEHDGLAALEAARTFRPEIILLDVGLPGLNGVDVARTLRDDPSNADLLIVALSGYGQAEDIQRSLEAGMDEHLVKPPSLESLEALFTHPKLPPR